MRRVVVTGLGLVTPVGADVETAWANIKAGRSGAGRITRFDPSDQVCTIACEVVRPDFIAACISGILASNTENAAGAAAPRCSAALV